MHNLAINRLALVSTIFASVVVLLGAWTRLVDAGLGCPDWPGCYGFFSVPTTSEEIATAEMRFPDAPVEVAKGWPEMIHRYFASSLGLLIIGLTILSIRERKKERLVASSSTGSNSAPLKHCIALLILVICQGLFGMWTVTLKLWPQVVSLHLIGGFTTLSLLYLLYLRTSPSARTKADKINRPEWLSRLNKLAIIALVLVGVQIFLGAWTASNYAALACGSDFPTCQSSMWPEMNFAGGFNFFQAIGPNYLGGLFDNESRVAIQMTHRIGALIVTLFLAYLLWAMKSLTKQLSHKQHRAAKWVLIFLLAQLLLGVSNVIWLIPLSIAVAHNGMGAVLLLSLVNLNYQLRCDPLTNKNTE